MQIAVSVSSDEPRLTLKPLFQSGSLRKNMKHINYILNAASPVDVSISILTVMLTSYKLLGLLNCLVDRFVV